MVCYRRHGHNEGDDPSYTQPLMYKAIAERRSVRKLYVESLVKRGDITARGGRGGARRLPAPSCRSALDETRAHAPEPVQGGQAAQAASACCPHVATGVDRGHARPDLRPASPSYPEGFTVHPKLARQFDDPGEAVPRAGEVDWATAEALAFGSLVLEGITVRLAGEDSRRGTFSQRHAALIDYENEQAVDPARRRCPARTANVLGLRLAAVASTPPSASSTATRAANKDALVMWEAQFGDFVNGAQIIIDQYLVAAEDKWGQTNGLVLLLPHGYEGQGPEHSLGPHRALPHAVRRGQHPGGQRHDRGAVLPPAAPPGAPRRAQAARRVHARSSRCA